MISSLAAYLERQRRAGGEPAYLLNARSKRAHIKPTEERCNMDQALWRRDSDYIPAGFRFCAWCAKRIA